MVSPDGQRLFAAGEHPAIQEWDTGTGTLRRELIGHNGPVLALDCSGNGRRLVSAGADTTVRIWDTSTGTELLVLPEQRVPVRCAAFTPDGRQLLHAEGYSGLTFRDTRPYAALAMDRQDDPAAVEEPRNRVLALYARLGDWREVGRSVRADADLSTAQRREALNRIPPLCSEHDVPATNWDLAFFTWEPTQDAQECHRRWQIASKAEPLLKEKRRLIDIDSRRDPRPAGAAQFGLIATASRRANRLTLS